MRTEMRPKELAALKQVVDDFQRRGFKVTIEPGPDELPEFLGSIKPDAIAEKEDKHFLIEVSAAPSVETAQTLSRMTELVRNHPEWQLAVIWAGGPDYPAMEPELPDLRRQLEDVETLYRRGHKVASLLLSWSVLEGAARLFLRRKDEPVLETDSMAVIKNLVATGELEQDEFDQIRQVYALRNEVAHGNVSAPVDRAAVDFVKKLAERLVDGLQANPQP